MCFIQSLIQWRLASFRSIRLQYMRYGPFVGEELCCRNNILLSFLLSICHFLFQILLALPCPTPITFLKIHTWIVIRRWPRSEWQIIFSAEQHVTRGAQHVVYPYWCHLVIYREGSYSFLNLSFSAIAATQVPANGQQTTPTGLQPVCN